MKRFFLCIVLLLKGCSQYAQTNTLSLQLEQLNHAIKEVPQLDKEKLAQINRLKNSFTKTSQTELSKQFELCGALYNAYKLFQYDSAFNYARKLQAISVRMQNPSLINYSRIQLGFILLSSGMYKETLDSLSAIDIRRVPDSSKAEYYALMGRYYYDWVIMIMTVTIRPHIINLPASMLIQHLLYFLLTLTIIYIMKA